MSRDVVSVSDAASCSETVAQMRGQNASSAVVVDQEGFPIGIVTEQDVLRKVAFVAKADTPVSKVMSTPVSTIGEDDLLFQGIARMRRRALRHMPVLDARGRAVGILQLHHALAAASTRLMGHVEAMTQARTIEGMKRVKDAQINIAIELLDDGENLSKVQSLLCAINNDIYHQVIEICIEEMRLDDWGQPPVPFEVVVMGSGGRGESFLGPDQDNGFILGDYPEDAHARVARWFIELAERMTVALDAVGFPFCKGHVMATNPLWRKSLSEWRQQIGLWVERRNPKVMLLCDIFFDFACVYGSGTMTASLREFVRAAVRHPGFLGALCLADQSHDVGLNWLGRLRSASDPGQRRGMLNLKMAGILPLVGSTRLLALREGIGATGTPARLDGLFEKSALSRNEHQDLIVAIELITRLLLGQQLEDVRRGRAFTKLIAIKELSRAQRDQLKQAFRSIRAFRAKVRSELTGTLVG